MKKLFYLLFISSVVLASCTKQEPIEVACNCGDTGISVDASLVGYWTRVDGIYERLAIGTDLSGNYYSADSDWGGFYSCDGYSHLSFTSLDNEKKWTNKYSISGNIMTLFNYDQNNNISDSTTFEKL